MEKKTKDFKVKKREKNFKGRRSQYKDIRDGSKTDVPGSDLLSRADENDFDWYNLNKNLTEMACRVPFGRPIGNKVELSSDSVTSAGVITTNTSAAPFPGILSFHMAGAVGCSLKDAVQTIDTASKSIYSWVRHANSGHTNYDSPDLTIYLLSAREIYAAAGYMLKVCGCVNKYDPTNRYYPDLVLRTLNIDPDMIRANQADLRYYCAQWFKKAASLFTPKALNLYKKAFWMFTQIFEEDKTGKSGLYQYVPSGFYVYNATKYTTGGCLEYKGLPTFSTFASFVTYFDALLNPLINDEDMGIMSGDIKKAFGDNIWSLPEFPYDIEIRPVRDSFVLQQMHNTIPMGINTIPDIVQDNTTNEILWFPKCEASTNYDSIIYNRRGYGHLLDIDAEVPTSEEVMEATQYMNSLTLKVAGQTYSRLSTYASITGISYPNNKSYILTNASDYFCNWVTVTTITANGSWSQSTYSNNMESLTSGTQTAAKVWTFCTRLSSFEFAPIFNMHTDTPPLGSIHNYTIVASEVLDNIHDAAWLSLLCIPAQEHLK